MALAWLLCWLNDTHCVYAWKRSLVWLTDRLDLEVWLAQWLAALGLLRGILLLHRVLGCCLWRCHGRRRLHTLHLSDFGTDSRRAVLALLGDLVHQGHYLVLKCVQWVCELRRVRLLKSFVHGQAARLTDFHRWVYFHIDNAWAFDHMILFAPIVCRAAFNKAWFVILQVDHADELVIILTRNHLNRLILLVQVGNFLWNFVTLGI